MMHLSFSGDLAESNTEVKSDFKRVLTDKVNPLYLMIMGKYNTHVFLDNADLFKVNKKDSRTMYIGVQLVSV